MKLLLIILFILAFASLSFGQTPSASPTPTQSASPEKGRAKPFGFSLGKYRDKEQRNSQNKQESNEPVDVESIRVTTDLVVNDVLVTDQNGKMISELNKDDFVVTEDGAPQKIEVFSRGENASVPRSIVLIINSCTPNVPYLKKSIAAAKTLVDELSPQDKMAIVTVDVRLLVDFTENKTLLKKTLDSVEKKSLEMVIPGLGHFPGCGGSREFEALLATLNEMFEEKNRQPIIIFQGDATEVTFLKPDKDAPYPIYDSIREISGLRFWEKGTSMSYLEFSDVKEAIERSRATIYSLATGIRFLGFSKKERMTRGEISVENVWRSISLGLRVNPRIMAMFRYRPTKVLTEFFTEVLTAAQTAMLRIAELSGGNMGFIEKPEDAETVYSTIFKLISNRYLIGYYPTNQVRDGKRREIKVEVRNHPEYVVTGRKAYFPQ